MKTRDLVVIAAALEVMVGAALIVAPEFVVHLLIDASLSSGGIADGVSAQALSALFTYNLLAAVYIDYLGTVGGFVGYLLWPACALHALVALLLASPAYEAGRREWPGVQFFSQTRS